MTVITPLKIGPIYIQLWRSRIHGVQEALEIIRAQCVSDHTIKVTGSVVVFYSIDDCEHPLLYLLDTGIATQETDISGSFQQNLASVCNGVSVWRLIS